MPLNALDISRTALVLIDLQKGVTAMPTEPHSADTVMSNAVRLAEAFREQGSLVVLVRVAFTAGGRDVLRPDIEEPVQARQRSEGWSEIDPRLGPKEGDLIITKRQWGAFYGTELDLVLRRSGISTIVLGGIATNFGVESTARDAYERGYNQVFISDAMSARSVEDHEFALGRIFPRIGRIATTNEAIAALKS